MDNAQDGTIIKETYFALKALISICASHLGCKESKAAKYSQNFRPGELDQSLSKMDKGD